MLCIGVYLWSIARFAESVISAFLSLKAVIFSCAVKAFYSWLILETYQVEMYDKRVYKFIGIEQAITQQLMVREYYLKHHRKALSFVFQTSSNLKLEVMYCSHQESPCNSAVSIKLCVCELHSQGICVTTCVMNISGRGRTTQHSSHAVCLKQRAYTYLLIDALVLSVCCT